MKVLNDYAIIDMNEYSIIVNEFNGQGSDDISKYIRVCKDIDDLFIQMFIIHPSVDSRG